jgi:hypothetical protein
MGVKIKKRGGKWYVFVNYHGQRKAKCVGPSRQIAEQVRRQVEARLALGDLGFLGHDQEQVPTFREYAKHWLSSYADLECKPSTGLQLRPATASACDSSIWRSTAHGNNPRRRKTVPVRPVADDPYREGDRSREFLKKHAPACRMCAARGHERRRRGWID